MSVFRDIIERLRALVFRRQLDRELDEELRFHLDRETAEQRRSASPDPQRAARLALGGVTQVREAVREARGIEALDFLVADIRFALRSLRRSWGFTLTVIGVLGLAIGATTAVFSVVDRVLLTGLPYDEPDELVRIYQQYPSSEWGTISVVDFQAIAEQQTAFEAVGLLRPAAFTVTGIGTPEFAGAGRVTSGFFEALGVRPMAGRLIEARDDIPGAPPVVVVTHEFATRALGGAEAAVGRTMLLDGLSHEVVGVLTPERRDLAGIRVPLWPAMQLTAPERRGPFGYRGIARLRDGVTLDDAARDLAAISQRIFPLWKTGFQDSAAKLLPVTLQESIVGRSRSQIDLFGGAVALILLLAVANVATLLLVRSSAREQEFATRSALGAGRSRLVRLVVTECLVLTMLAGAAGVAVAAYALRGVAFVAPSIPRVAGIAFDSASLAVAIGLAATCGLLVSLAPVSAVLRWGRSRASLGGTASARSGTGRRARAVRSTLVVLEFALALPLLVGAALLGSSFLRLQKVDPGFDPRSLYAVTVSLPARYPNDTVRRDFWRQLLVRVADRPEFATAGLTGDLPPDNQGNVNNFELLDRPIAPGESQPVTPWTNVSSGLFATLGVRLLDGRDFGPGDTLGSPPVVIVSRAWAAKYFPNETAIGRQLYSGGCTTCPPTTVIGVVSDVPYRGLDEEKDAVYTPLERNVDGSTNLLVRSRTDQAATFRALREVLAALDPDIAPTEIALEERMATEFADPRRWTVIVGSFAVAGLVLAALGIFGLMSYVVRQRRRELGIRLALGAPPDSLTALVVGSGVRHALAGVVIGLALSVAGTQWLEASLFGVRATDPITLAIAAIAILALASAASWLPGRSAARIRPSEALQGP